MDYVATHNLTKRFSQNRAVDDANITLEKGKVYGLLGPNGSGKSTFMKMVAGLFHPSKGKIEVMGDPLSYRSKEYVSFMTTEQYFYDYMTVGMVGRFHRDFYADFDPNTYEELIGEMQLSMDMKVKSLSSGMTAKLKIAATMARDAKVFMLDEPLNGIDLVARDAILSAIIRKADPDNCILISSHLIDAMENILDDVIFIKEGQIVICGNAENIREERGKSIVDLYKEVFA